MCQARALITHCWREMFEGNRRAWQFDGEKTLCRTPGSQGCAWDGEGDGNGAGQPWCTEPLFL